MNALGQIGLLAMGVNGCLLSYAVRLVIPLYKFHGAREFAHVHDQDTVNIHGVYLSRMHTGLVICTIH